MRNPILTFAALAAIVGGAIAGSNQKQPDLSTVAEVVQQFEPITESDSFRPAIADSVESDRLTSAQILDLYSANETEIAGIWATLGDDATMRDAVLKWLKQNPARATTKVVPVAVQGAKPSGVQTPEPGTYKLGRDAEAEKVPFGPEQGTCCNGDCCKCDPSRTPYYYSGADRKWYPTRSFTASEAAAENSRLERRAPVNAPVTAASQLRSPLMLPQFGGDCVNGQCANGVCIGGQCFGGGCASGQCGNYARPRARRGR